MYDLLRRVRIDVARDRRIAYLEACGFLWHSLKAVRRDPHECKACTLKCGICSRLAAFVSTLSLLFASAAASASPRVTKLWLLPPAATTAAATTATRFAARRLLSLRHLLGLLRVFLLQLLSLLLVFLLQLLRSRRINLLFR
jgi:hypothetical protein